MAYFSRSTVVLLFFLFFSFPRITSISCHNYYAIKEHRLKRLSSFSVFQLRSHCPFPRLKSLASYQSFSVFFAFRSVLILLHFQKIIEHCSKSSCDCADQIFLITKDDVIAHKIYTNLQYSLLGISVTHLVFLPEYTEIWPLWLAVRKFNKFGKFLGLKFQKNFVPFLYRFESLVTFC